MQEPFFRKSVLVQLKIAYQIVTNEHLDKLNKLSTKEAFLPLTEPELQVIKKYDELISFLLKRYKYGANSQSSTSNQTSGKKQKNVNDAVNKALKNELHWAQWKALGCQPFNKETTDDKKLKFWDCQNLVGKHITQAQKNRWFDKGAGNILMPDFQKHKQRKVSLDGWFGVDKDYNHMDFLDKENIMVNILFFII